MRVADSAAEARIDQALVTRIRLDDDHRALRASSTARIGTIQEDSIRRNVAGILRAEFCDYRCSFVSNVILQGQD